MYKFVICSDVHTEQPHATHPVYAKYSDYTDCGVLCCGDFPKLTNGLFAPEPSSTIASYGNARDTLAAFAALGRAHGGYGILCAGNHDSVYVFGRGRGTDKAAGIAAYNTLAGYSGYTDGNGVNHPYINVREYKGDVFIAVSDYSEGNAVYDTDTQTTVIDLIDNKYEGKRIILLTHYAFHIGDDYSDAYASRVGLDQSLVYKKALKYPSGTVAEATMAGFFTSIASNHPNVLWFSGHTHNDWRLQEDAVTVTDKNGDDHTDGPYPNIKAYRYPGGALMINLPSVRYRGQDAIVEAYSDRIEVHAREVNATIRDKLLYDNSAASCEAASPGWDFAELGDDYVFTLTWDNPEIDEDTLAYNINGQPITTAGDINGNPLTALYNINGQPLV